jgi:TolA-binding protein
MMNIDDAYLTNLLLASTIALLAAATVAILRFQRLLRQWELKLDATPATTVQPAAEVAGQPLDARINALEKIAEQLARKEEMLQQKGRNDVPLEHAVRMARSGAGVEELTRSCGLKKGEAELLLKLHAKREPVAGARPH